VASLLLGMDCFPKQDCPSIFVLVKEGTRLLDESGSRWKVSFHFIFQIICLQLQFTAVYEAITNAIAT
jgi:hypothetical protein